MIDDPSKEFCRIWKYLEEGSRKPVPQLHVMTPNEAKRFYPDGVYPDWVIISQYLPQGNNGTQTRK